MKSETLHKQAEEANSLLAAIVESSNDAIIGKTLDGTILSWNQGAQNIYGYLADEVKGRSISILAPPDKTDEIPSFLQKIRQGQCIEHYETVRVKKDGKQIEVCLTISPIKDSTGKIIGASTIARDITERRLAEEKLHRAHDESENAFRSLFENMINGYAHCKMLFDENGRPADFVYLKVNPAFGQLIGLENVAGKKVTEAIPGIKEAHPELFEIYGRVALTGQPETFEIKFKPLGVWLSVSVYSPKREYFIAVFDNITERKRMEQEREVAIEFLRLVNESTGMQDMIRKSVTFFQQQSGCEAAGIRLKDGDDYPYFETRGFPKEFVRAENSLCARDSAGNVLRNSAGYPINECMCGNVICGRFDPSRPFFTMRGSFWTNCTTELLATTTEADRQARTRNRCNGEGYESVALIALQAGREKLGLLQLNDSRKGLFSPEVIALWERLAGYLAIALAKFCMEEALRRTHDELEIRVQERTAELARANEALQAEITQREHAEDNISKLLKELKTIFENIPLGIAYFDAEFKFISANKFLCDLTGLGEDNLIGRHCYETVGEYADSTKKGREKICSFCKKDECFNTRRPTVIERPLMDSIVKVTTVPQLDEDGNIYRFLEIIENITERKLSEAELRESEERYRKLVDFSPFGIVIQSNHEIIYANPAAMKIFGVSKTEELIGEPVFRFVHSKYHDIVKERIHKQIHGEIAPPMELKFLRLNGTSVDVELVSIPFTHAGKQGTYAIIQDITEHKKIKEICLENERLLLASKAKSEFVATMSHELRTPLTSIIGFSELLRDKKIAGELNKQQEHFLSKVLANSNHLLELINNILDLSKIEAGKIELVIEKFSVPSTIDETLNLIKETATKRNIVIKKELEPLDIEADKLRFKQVLLNLLNNAVKFSKPDGGVVTISAKRSGDKAQISISDTGIGIKKDDIERMFWAFEQLESGISRKYGGTGLGLAISKRLVELHGGTVEIKSKYGEGSTFTFSLPVTINQS